MSETEIIRLRRKNHEAIHSSRKRLLICMAISLAVWAAVLLGSLTTL